ncbi:hypothetical protein N7U66_02730 [Lacinutrix neustonica]|uniref:STAS/SEC14 domain-containing protein n=1 Tax=Lacinutrix neustonica TaxID=2980107 RepID=A0A9E8MW13_9FLAO|nr:hypothetical protein [Lacinutrix neustonica]WAC02623.1 hypothetical protein N7U66_02730 [Lacinutrix neustonica]
MRIKDANLTEELEDIHLSEYGYYYFFKDFIVAEINPGVSYTWEEARDIIEAAYSHYGPDPSVCYITNRVNKYSVNPADWLKFFKNNHALNGYAIVSYTERSWINATLEKIFLSTKVEHFSDLNDAIAWAKKRNADVKTSKTMVK